MITEFQGGLLTETGAALILGDKLGVKAPNTPEKPEVKPMYIQDVLNGKPKDDVPEIVATVLEVYERKDFTKKTGESGFVIAVKLGDATGNCRFSFFNDVLKKLGIDSPSVGQIYTFKNCTIEAPYGDKATKNSLGTKWGGKSSITKGGTVPDAPAGTPRATEADKAGTPFTFSKASAPTPAAGKDYKPLLVKVVTILCKKAVNAEGTGVDFTKEEEADLNNIIGGIQ
jgi:hypothetical protein